MSIDGMWQPGGDPVSVYSALPEPYLISLAGLCYNILFHLMHIPQFLLRLLVLSEVQCFHKGHPAGPNRLFF